jgi:glycerophosphoryl diester phosphodiesterase
MMLCMLGAIAMMAPAKPSTKAIIAQSWKETLVVGHRGAAAYKPENTLPAFEEAISCKVSATECDIHLSQDGEMVVMHDKTLDRTTSLKGEVAKTPWPTMKEAGIPSLSDLTKVTKDRVVLVVEIKHGEGIEKKMLDHLNRENLLDQSIVFSFGEDHIRETERLDSRYFSVWLVGKALKPEDYAATLDRAKELGSDGVGFQYRNVTPELVKAVQDRKIPIFVWTVPPGPEVDRLKALKVNFIITDHPRDVRAQLGLKD